LPSKEYFESEGTQYYVKRRNPTTGEMEQRKVDTYENMRDGDFWDLWILGHIAKTTNELVLVEKEKKRMGL
jgi:hypothetical protein